MKELIDFLQREFSDDVKEIQTDLQCICDCLDRVHSEVDKRLPTIKGDYSKIGEYYAMGQELKQKIQSQRKWVSKMSASIFYILNILKN